VRQASGLVSTLLWATDESPADISGSADRAAREIGVPPPPLGSVFRVVEFPPGRGELSREAVLKEMGLSGQAASQHAGMHRTRSVDYAVVMEGEIDMILDEGEVHLAAGDVLVQQGTNHAWVNRGERACRIAFVLIDAAGS
jgi:mannose-6-phosphate isomerase-like protein (cupin superfamily)